MANARAVNQIPGNGAFLFGDMYLAVVPRGARRAESILNRLDRAGPAPSCWSRMAGSDASHGTPPPEMTWREILSALRIFRGSGREGFLDGPESARRVAVTARSWSLHRRGPPGSYLCRSNR